VVVVWCGAVVAVFLVFQTQSEDSSSCQFRQLGADDCLVRWRSRVDMVQDRRFQAGGCSWPVGSAQGVQMLGMACKRLADSALR
jgi:hypothetical protein